MASKIAPASLSVFNQIRAKILMSGPITIADYMKIALFQNVPATATSRIGSSETSDGYYMRKDVFGAAGDFTTNPEISQMFGEMVGVWGYQTWVKLGGPKNVSIVEMGPGRGTMAKDVLRVFRTFLPTSSKISLHLVEISPFMANLQLKTLCGQPSKQEFAKAESINPNENVQNAPYYYQAITPDTNVPIFWYRELSSLPKDFHFYIAHEFFDVLPIHKLQKIQNVWKEVLIDLSNQDESFSNQQIEKEKLRYVISRHQTPAIKILENLYASLLLDSREHLEISLEMIQICEELCSRLEADGGMALVVDYGHEGTKEDTFRGFLQHKVVDPLEQVGQADLTADVDFSNVRKICQDKALILGTIKQRDFLARIGIGTRARALFKNCQSRDEKKEIASAYKMLMTELGDKFHCLALLPKVMEKYRPKLKVLAFDFDT